MKFKSVEAAEQAAKTGSSVFANVTVEDFLNDMEHLRQCDKAYKAMRAEFAIPLSFNAMIEKSCIAGKPAVEALSLENASELASAIGCADVEELKGMSLESFIGKCEAQLDFEPSQEVFAEVAGAVIILFVYIFAVSGIIIMCAKAGDKNYIDFDSIYRTLEKAFGNKINDALENITVNTWTRKEYEAQIAAAKDALVILRKPAEQIFDEKFELKNIEKAAAKLWAAPAGFAYNEDGSSWAQWYEEVPDRQRGKTLKELGFDVKSLIKVCHDLKALCLEFATIGEVGRDLANAKAKATKVDKPGFIKRIVNMFKGKDEEDEATKEEKARQRRIAVAKYDACYYLCRGISAVVDGMAVDMVLASRKAEKLAKKGPVKEA